MGEVYLAEHKYIARKAAIKFLLRDLSNSSELVGRFFAEARAASVIKHPGIVEVLDCDVHDGRAYIVMELLRGESLRDYIERVGSVGRDEPGALGIFRQIASALAAAHAQEIVHRDLKPDNIYLHVAEEGSPTQPIAKVLDFGIAKLMGRGEGGTKTRTGQLLGTPMYMSPEQCRGVKQIDNRSDIYSLGCIMYEVFCGNAPFLDEGFGDLIIAHVSRPPPEPLHAAPWMSAPSRRLLLDCLAKDPADRPQSMRDVVARLSQLYPSEEILLQIPVSVEPRPRAGAATDGRTSGSRSGQRLMQTTPMPASAAISSSGSTLTAPLEEPMMPVRSPSGGFGQQRPMHSPGAITTPSGAGRTRVLLPEDTVPGRPRVGDPSTLNDGAVERYKTAPRTRGTGSKVAIGVAAVAAIVLAALVIVRVVAPQPAGGDRETSAQNESAGDRHDHDDRLARRRDRACAERAAPAPAAAGDLGDHAARLTAGCAGAPRRARDRTAGLGAARGRDPPSDRRRQWLPALGDVVRRPHRPHGRRRDEGARRATAGPCGAAPAQAAR